MTTDGESAFNVCVPEVATAEPAPQLPHAEHESTLFAFHASTNGSPAFTLIVLVPLAPCATVKLLGLAESEKSPPLVILLYLYGV